MNETIILLLISSGLSWGLIFYLLLRKDRPVGGSDVTRLVLLDESAGNKKEWGLYEKKGLLIGKSGMLRPADLQLPDEAGMGQVAEEHAVLNYIGGCWYLEALQSDCVTGLRKNGKSIVYRLKAFLPYKIEAGDMVFISHYKLEVR